MQIVSATDGAVNVEPPPPHHRLQTLIVSGASLRRLMRTAGLRTTDPTEPVAIVGVGPSFPKVSGIDWCAACDELPPGDALTFPDLRDLVWALVNTSLFIHVDGDAESVEALHDYF